MKPNEFRCLSCKGTFEKGLTNEEAIKEAVEIFGEYAEEDFALVCDDCFKRVNDCFKRMNGKLPMASWGTQVLVENLPLPGMPVLPPGIVSQQDAMSCIEYILDHEGEDYYEQEPEDRPYHIYKCALDALGLKDREEKDEEAVS